MLRGVATLNLDDFVYEKVPELLLMRTLNVFKPFQCYMQDYGGFTLRSGADNEELRFFYPAIFFLTGCYACLGWTQLIVCFHLLAKIKPAKNEIKSVTDGTTGVCITIKNDAPGLRLDLLSFVEAEKLTGNLNVPVTVADFHHMYKLMRLI